MVGQAFSYDGVDDHITIANESAFDSSQLTVKILITLRLPPAY
jgi:hypothetical protein